MRGIVDHKPRAHVIQVIEASYLRGEGVAPDDPVREVVAYYSLDGELLAERDSWADLQPEPLRRLEPSA